MSATNDNRNVISPKPVLLKEERTQAHFVGHVVSMTENKLVIKNKEGQEYSHSVDKDAKITCDGVDCKPEEVKPGNKVRVTTKKDNRKVVTGIESLDKQLEFAKSV